MGAPAILINPPTQQPSQAPQTPIPIAAAPTTTAVNSVQSAPAPVMAAASSPIKFPSN